MKRRHQEDSCKKAKQTRVEKGGGRDKSEKPEEYFLPNRFANYNKETNPLQAHNSYWKQPKIIPFQMISDHIEDSNKQVNERRESIQNDLPKNINVIQQGSSDSEMELNTNSKNEKKKSIA